MMHGRDAVDIVACKFIYLVFATPSVLCYYGVSSRRSGLMQESFKHMHACIMHAAASKSVPETGSSRKGRESEIRLSLFCFWSFSCRAQMVQPGDETTILA
jgi:hypothetical protein